ncbi:putative chitinase [Beggiatoa alba B18LD]|uniref:Putative chitinase n=1 Tax=Beggiatoa alba B18LD TaxID=395493 RepID=I3CCF5_9GAMM|nr:putative chitinase [Beggiatoa alba]EIJ41298.1 putative chitinase [Beggiatoa alba B18LD]
MSETNDNLKKLQEMGFNLDINNTSPASAPTTSATEIPPSSSVNTENAIKTPDVPVNPVLSEALTPFTIEFVATLFPSVSRRNIEKYLMTILSAFQTIGLTDKKLVLLAIATIRAESVRFEPISEYKSKYNTSPNGRPFDLYDNRADLGNQGAPDGERFKGRGFIQLTGRANYQKYGDILKLETALIDNPDLANDPMIAAELLARFILDKETRIRRALENNDLKSARRAINGGSHGLKEFSEAYLKGLAILEGQAV